MKAFSSKSLLIAIPLSIFFGSSILAQEYDDVYFRKSDRKKLEEQAKKPIDFPKEDEQIAELQDDDLLSYDDEPYTEDEYYSYDDPNYEYESDANVIEKHYYYGSAYNNNFDPTFWNDPYLYQGRFFDPYYSSFYRDRYYRPGWSVSFGFGYNSWGWNRWRYRSNYYWGSPYYYTGYYGWDSYFNPWYSNSYWCPPGGYYNSVIVVNNNSGKYRGVVRGRRTTRGGSYGSAYHHDPRGGRTSGDIRDGKGRSGGRYDGGTIGKEGKAGRYENRSDYSDFKRPGRSSGTDSKSNPRITSPRKRTTPSRSNDRNYTPTQKRGSNTRINNGNSRSRSTDTYRPSRSSSNSSSYGGSRSSGGKSSSSSDRTGRKRD